MRRQNLINLSLDNLIYQTRDAIGTQGSLSNRLNQSINQDGSLKKEALNDANHDIGSHDDDEFENYETWSEDRDGPFVRVLKSEVDKLKNVADNATNLKLDVIVDEENTVNFTSGVVKLSNSSSLSWSVESPNIIKGNLSFPSAAAHRHFYDQIPVHANTTTPNYLNYKVNSTSTPYVEGSLRIYINGVRLTSTNSIYVPGSLADDSWTLMTFTPNHLNGTFQLSNNISNEDIIRIDYDIKYL